MRFAFLPLLALLACGDDEQEARRDNAEAVSHPAPAAQAPAPTAETVPAVARIEGVGGQTAQGTVTFEPTEAGVRVHAEITGLTPGLHGFHVHENGSCADAAEAAGGHFAPDGDPHAAPTADKRHVGDLGNLEADAEGKAVYDRVDTEVALEGDRSVVGKAVVIHSAADDFATQPSGGSGARVACGVIERAQPGT